MAVRIGSARIDENGEIHGGKAGDQNGKEVAIQNWYKHSKGWIVLRPKDAAKAEKIAKAMERACANSKIGYDQYSRNTLYDAVKPLGFDPGKVTTAVETDCSALVRVCCAYAGIMAADFNTASEVAALMATGAFDKLTAAKYTDSSDLLRRGNVLVTQTKGHTVVVLDNGPGIGGNRPTLKKGSKGAQVKTLQNLLISHGYKLPKYGADGDYGDETVKAVKAFQKDNGLTVDGIVGAKTWAALMVEPKTHYRLTITSTDKVALEALKKQHGGTLEVLQ